MKGIQLKNSCIFYYGNPAGYVEDEKAVLDSIFKSEELENWINQRKLIPKWTDGVFERLSKGGGDINDKEIVVLKDCRIWQLKTDVSPGRKFIGYEELMKNFGEIDRDIMGLFMMEKLKAMIWKRFIQNLILIIHKDLKDIPCLFQM